MIRAGAPKQLWDNTLEYEGYIRANNGESVLKQLDKYFKLKEDLVGDPEVYLEAKLKRMRLENGV